jgi:hypothetical protein
MGQPPRQALIQKQQTSQRLRDRFDDWRRSGRVELPDLSEFSLD